MAGRSNSSFFQEELITVKQAADLLGRTESTVRRMIRSGRLTPAYRRTRCRQGGIRLRRTFVQQLANYLAKQGRKVSTYWDWGTSSPASCWD